MYAFHQSVSAITSQIAMLEEDLRRAEDAGEVSTIAQIEERLVEFETELQKREEGLPK